MLIQTHSAGKTLEEVVHIFEDPKGIKNIGTPAWKTRVDRKRVNDVESHNTAQGEKSEAEVAEVQGQLSGSGSNSNGQTEPGGDNHQQHDMNEHEVLGEKGNGNHREIDERNEKVDGVSVKPDKPLSDEDKHEHDREDEIKQEEEEDAEKRWRMHITEVLVRAILKGDMGTAAAAWSAGLDSAEKLIEDRRTAIVSNMGKERGTERDAFGLDECLKFTPTKAEAMVGTGQEGVDGVDGI